MSAQDIVVTAKRPAVAASNRELADSLNQHWQQLLGAAEN